MQKQLPPATPDALNPPAKNYTFFENVAAHPFQPDDTAVNLRNAWWLMDAAMLSYSSQADVEKAFSAAGLGAALATLAANLCSDQPNHLGLKGLYTYGSPRVGDQAFGKRIPSKVWRFRNNSDIVTHVPIGIVFRHVGALEFIDGAGHAHL